MSRHPEEAAEITAGCSSLVLNMGTVSDLDAMLGAGAEANRLGHPVILDPVGAGASALRRRILAQLTTQIHPDLIRGNASEIRFLYDGSGKETGGVDASPEDGITWENAAGWGSLAAELAERLGCIISVSGQIDVLSDGKKTYLFPGGCPEMSRITGSGCMLTALMGAFLGAEPGNLLDAAVCAQGTMNAAGEAARKKMKESGGGTMTFRLHLIDAVSLMTGGRWNEYAKVNELSLCDL
jgi:hydroxyethylthiazole kinase